MDNENSRNFNVTAKATASQKENYRKKAEQEGLSLSEWIVTVLDLYIEGHEAKKEPKQELPKTEVDWSKFPKATQLKLKMQKLHKKIINGFQEEPKQDLEKEMFELEEQLDIPSHLRWHNSKPKQESLETFACKILAENGVYDEDMILSDTFSKVVNSMVDMAKSQDEKASFKHEFKVIPKEEILANRSNAYQFIDFDNQETVEEYFLDNIKNVLQFGNDAQAIRFMEKYFEAKCELRTKTLEEKLDKIVSKEPSKFWEESDKRMEAKAKLFRYSEEEVYHILCEHTAELFKGSKMTLTEWFNKVKKK